MNKLLIACGIFILVGFAGCSTTPMQSSNRPSPPSAPQQIKHSSPSLPANLPQGNYQLKIRYLIGADGAVHEPRVVNSSGLVALDNVYLRAASQWKYLPAKSDGKAVTIEADAPLTVEIGQTTSDSKFPNVILNLANIIDVKSLKLPGSGVTSFKVRVGYSLASIPQGSVSLSFDVEGNGQYKSVARKSVEQGTGEVELTAEIDLSGKRTVLMHVALGEVPRPGISVPFAYEIKQFENLK